MSKGRKSGYWSEALALMNYDGVGVEIDIKPSGQSSGENGTRWVKKRDCRNTNHPKERDEFEFFPQYESPAWCEDLLYFLKTHNEQIAAIALMAWGKKPSEFANRGMDAESLKSAARSAAMLVAIKKVQNPKLCAFLIMKRLAIANIGKPKARQ